MRSALPIFLVALNAAAWPVDVVVELEAGAERFERLAELSWIEVENPQVATAERLDSGEVLFTGIAPGSTLALLYAQGRAAVWRLVVQPKGRRARPPSPDLSAANRACPQLSVRGGELRATIADEACRKALLELFQTDAFHARQLELTFEVPALQSQLKAIDEGLSKAGLNVSARYLGTGLELKGRLTQAQHRRALWEVFKRSVGRMVLDDRIEVAESGAPEQSDEKKSTDDGP